MRPKFYYNDRFRLGPLSGSTMADDNPVARIADGDVGLYYLVTSGDPPVGVLQLTMPSGDPVGPTHLVIGKASNLNGYRLTLVSEDVDGGNQNNRVLVDLATDTYNYVVEVIGPAWSPRSVWRLTISGLTSGMEPAKLYEAMLADEQEMPRSNEVGVERTRVRQFTRIPVPGGTPFTKRDGPRLRRTGYSFKVLDGAEVAAMEAFVDAIEGGEFFFHIDDRAEQYMAELAGPGQVFSDTAGVYSINMTVQEVESD